MSILIAQLGDIHFKGHTDPAVSRGSQIGAAIAAEVTATVSSVVLAICGDAAFSGKRDQFEVAQKFVESIEAAIRNRGVSIPILRVIIPGNHDCDFSGDQAARNAMLGAVKESETPAKSISDIILQPLREYFGFAASFATPSHAIIESQPFYQTADIIENDLCLRLHLLNTAWMSSIHEQAGSLHFPLTAISPPMGRADCGIAILHHPTHWFNQPHVMRPLRDKIATLASVVLVNHEHVAEAMEQAQLYGMDGATIKTVYVSGGVIQEQSEPDLCTFNLLKADMKSKSLDLTRFEYRPNNGSPFFERTANATVSTSASTLNAGPAGAILTEGMNAFLEDPGVPITHPHRDPRIPVRLSDIFLYPDLWELDKDHDGSDQKQIRSSKVAGEVLSPSKVLITGGEKSGRTSIVKRLFMDAFNKGKIPLYLSGSEIPKKANQLRKAIRKAVEMQYANLTADAFEQLEPSQRIILIDDIHRMAPATNTRQELLDECERLFSSVILCGDDLLKLDQLKGNDGRNSGLWDYRHLVILGFGEYLREQFVRQWLTLGGDMFPSEDDVDSEVERICGLLNIVIKKQLLPAYPLFLLVVLQQTDLANASVQGGSFGKLFEGVITAILNKSEFQRISIGDKYHYLAALSKKLFDAKKMSLSTSEAQTWHRAYWDDIELSIDFERLVKDLAMLGVLTVTEAEIQFKYAYFFCFFMAYHLNRTVHENETRLVISQLCKQLHHRISADIVLFLAHLTGDPIVLNEMVTTCDQLFSEIKPTTLDLDVEPLNRLGDAIQSIAIPDKPDETRRQLQISSDALIAERLAATKEAHEVDPPEADNEAIRRVFDIHAAYKTIQILGQAIRNISGSASKERKEDIIKKIIGLSRRVLGVYFDLFANNTLPSIIEDMAAAHKEHQSEISRSDLYQEVCRHLSGLSLFVCFSMIKHTTFSLGSENLSPTIHRVLGQGTEPIEKVYDLSFDLERPGRFPKDAAVKLYNEFKKNAFVAGLVRVLIAHHMYLYVVPYDERQTVCDKMSIKLLPTVMDRSRKRLT